MAIVITDDKHYKAIANKIRYITKTNALMKPANMPDAIQTVYIKGQLVGNSFWDTYQQNGARSNYDFAFAGAGWTDETFTPKYDIVANSQQHMFSSCGIVDITACLAKAGVSLDLSKVTSSSYFLQNNSVTERVPVLNFTSASRLAYLFFNCKNLKYIDGIILKDDGSQSFTAQYSFGQLPELEEIRFSGKIGNSINFQGSPKLSVESARSIIESLVNYAGTDKEGLNSLILHANVWTRLEASGAAPDGGTWENYVIGKGWSK